MTRGWELVPIWILDVLTFPCSLLPMRTPPPPMGLTLVDNFPPDRRTIARQASAASHCGLRGDKVLSIKPLWVRTLSDVRQWSAWLVEGDEEGEVTELRRNVDKGLPCGNARFISKLEKLTNRVLRYRPQGRPRVNKG